MARKRRRRPNWPYRFAWLGIWLALLGYVSLQTILLASTYGRRAYGTDWGLSFVASLFDTTVAIFFFVVGACIGSFLNVVAYRLPLGRFIGGHSACPYCKTPIDGADNVPFLAWVKLRGALSRMPPANLDPVPAGRTLRSYPVCDRVRHRVRSRRS
jgi:leader peptidase (prepilin peptidase)/N-methyltransferase